MKQTRNIKAGTQMDYESVPFHVDTIPMKSYTYNLFVYGHINNAFDAVNVITALQQATPDDTVNLFLSGEGGCLSGIDALLHAIEMARENGVCVHCVVSGLVASAFTFIPLACSSFELAAGTCFLIHCGSLNGFGTLNEYRTASAFHVQYMEERFKAQYEHFLTPQEIEELLKGQDMWLNAQQWAERYEKRNEILLELSKTEKEIEEVAE